MECTIEEGFTEEECLNSKIGNEVRKVINTYNSDKYKIYEGVYGYRVYKNPTITSIKDRIMRIIFDDNYNTQLLFEFYFKSPIIEVHVHDPNMVYQAEKMMQDIFYEIDGLKIVIKKKYCPHKYQQ